MAWVSEEKENNEQEKGLAPIELVLFLSSFNRIMRISLLIGANLRKNHANYSRKLCQFDQKSCQLTNLDGSAFLIV